MIENMKIDGFMPIIINVTPVTNLPMILGLNTLDEEPERADTERDLDPIQKTEKFRVEDVEQVSYL